MNRPLVSVLICNHNYAAYLGTAVESALTQSYPRTEVIVVDDGSTDGSREVLAGYTGRITTVLKEQSGQNGAVNAGLARCRGELVAFLDSDDVFLPTKIERVVQVAEQAPGALLYYHRLRTIDPEGRPRGRGWPHDVLSGDVRKRVEAAGGWWPRPTTSATVLPRAFLERIAPFPEDQSLGRRWCDAYFGDLAPRLGEVRGIPDVLTHYRVHGTNTGVIVDPEARVRQQVFEVEQAIEGLRRLGEQPERPRLDRHLGLARAAALAHPRSALAPAVRLALRSPVLSPVGRIMEAVQILRSALRGLLARG